MSLHTMARAKVAMDLIPFNIEQCCIKVDNVVPKNFILSVMGDY